MMSFQSRLEPIGTAFAAVIPNTYHYWRPNLPAPFLIWNETGDTSFESGNQKAEQGITGQTDYYTKMEFDPAVDQIQETMEVLGLAWELSDVLYEEETELIHYSWSWEVC